MKSLPLALVISITVTLAACSAPSPSPMAATPAPSPMPPTPTAMAPAPIRVVALATGFPFLLTTVVKQKGLDRKYGLEFQVTELSDLTQQWNALRGGSADLAMGNFLDLLRQYKAGLKVKAVYHAYDYDDPIVTTADKPYSTLGDLKGVRLGVTNVSALPVIMYRAAGKKAFGIDLVKDTNISEAAPGLLLQSLQRGQVDATYTLRSLAFQGLAEGKLKEVTNLQKVLKAAGFDVPLTLWVLSDDWRAKYGQDAVARLVAMLIELNDTVRNEDTGWDAYASKAGIQDASLVPRFKTEFRGLLVLKYEKDRLSQIDTLIKDLTSTVGQEAVGVAGVDPAAFDMESLEAAKKLLKR